MKIAVDTNIIIRCIQPQHPDSQQALHATAQLLLQQHELCWFPQHHYEFWVVATRPKSNNGFGLTTNQAVVELNNLHTRFTFLNDRPALYNFWLHLVSNNGVIGKPAHDARIIAAMQTHGISHLLTFNANDFKRFQNITILTPADVLAVP